MQYPMDLSGFSSSSSSSAWITSMSCSLNPIHSSDNFFDSACFQWLKFIVIAPCPQRAMLSTAAGLFIVVLLVLALHRLFSKFITNRTSNSRILHRNHKLIPHTTLWFKLTLSVTLLLTLCYTFLCIFSYYRATQLKNMDALCWLIQAISHLTVAILLLHERRFEAGRHPWQLRSYWIANFVVVFLLAVSALIRLLSINHDIDPILKQDDIFLLSTLPLSLFLLAAAIRASTGVKISSNDAETRFQEPLLEKTIINTGFSSASFTSKAFWLWMNPLLKKGYISPLKVEDVPDIAEEHRAESTADLFERHWPKPGTQTNHPVVKTLFRCFWKDVVFTGALAMVRLFVMYVGPSMIQKFVAFTSGERKLPYEGYYLVLVLLMGKLVEVLSSHHLFFHCQKLGMLMRSTLITALYKKGLRLTCSARQDHGVGQIVNYMAVDAQQLSDMMMQFHSIWMTPLQVTIGCVILYIYLGKAMITSMVAIFAIFVYMLLGARRNNFFQQRIMGNKDMRMKATNEMLNNMKVIKFQAWEGVFGERIGGFREKEFGWLTKFWYSLTGNTVVLWSTPVLVATLTFGTAVVLGIPLDAGTVFTTTSLFRVLQDPIRSFPQAMIGISQAIVSLGRLDHYMVSRELSEEAVERGEGSDGDGDGTVVGVEDGVFSWDDDGCEVVLNNVNLKIRKGGVTAVVGIVGAGKSSLLASILGEMCKVSGKVKVCGTTAYVAQTSWIQNGTIEENILFGMPMDILKYRDVLRVCSLEKDIEMMEDGDQTEIGERGINLSGGQKQRIQLARAVYQDSDIYLLDDVFSAVDAHTGSDIFKECVRGALRNKTVVLVTHQIDFLRNIDLIVVMREGMIVESGKYEELLQQSVDFKALVDAHEASMELVEVNHVGDFGASDAPKSTDSNTNMNHPHSDFREKAEEQPKPAKPSTKLITEEDRETGTINMKVYKLYCTEAYGWWGVAAFILFSVLWQGCLMSSDYWLAHETSAKHTTKFDPLLFIKVYAVIASISVVLALLRSFYVTFWGLKTTQIFFNSTLERILHAPMSFFDTTPTGRILSRTSTDQANLDILVPFFLGLTVSMYLTLFSIIIITCQYAWPTTFLLIPLGWLNLWYRWYYISSSRELTRLQSISRTPIIHHFSESVSGVVTIRCFGKQERFFQENIDRVNLNLRMDFHSFASNEWFGLRLELIGTFLLCVSAAFMIVVPASVINPENVGLSLSYGLSLNGVLFFAVYMSCLAESKMVSVERMKQLTEIPAEAPWRLQGEGSLPTLWPNRGNVDLVNLMVRYRPNSPLVIKGITLGIQGGEKIGIVGRTGGGKSTLVQVFFRLVEACHGRVVVDGIDISTLGLHDLRSRFGIIPQEPVLFEGTVRSNIDPLGFYTDEELWKSLERCQLKEVISSKPEKLNSAVVESGENWSVGQRQLLCLGRVMLKQSRLLFMDEATASVDSHTDAVIQRIIREDFAACTIISIAHRIPTVMDCDRVLVVDSGMAKEFERPSLLLEGPSLFGALVREYANRSSEM